MEEKRYAAIAMRIEKDWTDDKELQDAYLKIV